MMQIRGISCIDLVSKKHDVATRCPRVDYVSPPPNVVSGEVETDEFVVVYMVLLQEHKVSCTAIKMMGAFIGVGCSDA